MKKIGTFSAEEREKVIKNNDQLYTGKDWEKDFDSLWEATTDNNGEKEPFEYERLKDFIHNLLSEAREKERERIKIWLYDNGLTHKKCFIKVRDFLNSLNKS